MARYIPADGIAAVAAAAGFARGADPKPLTIAQAGGDALEVAVAVALSESGGNTEAHNDNASTGDDSYGLWQINCLGPLKDSRPACSQTAKASDGRTIPALWVPSINAGEAIKLFHSPQGFRHWSDFNNGKYRAKLGTAKAGAAGITGDKPGDDSIRWDDVVGGLTDVPGAVADTVTAIPDFLGKLTDPVTWVRVAEFVGGGILVVMAVWMFARKLDIDLPTLPGPVGAAVGALT